jgi:hypothetical protein
LHVLEYDIAFGAWPWHIGWFPYLRHDAFPWNVSLYKCTRVAYDVFPPASKSSVITGGAAPAAPAAAEPAAELPAAAHAPNRAPRLARLIRGGGPTRRRRKEGQEPGVALAPRESQEVCSPPEI